MLPQLPPVRDRAPLLLTHTQWIEKEALAHMASVARANFAVLDDEQKKHYVALHRQAVAAFEAVEDENARLKDTFKSVHLALLRRELKTLTGVDIDPERTLLYTRYREFKEGRTPLDFISDVLGDEADARITLRAVDESRYVDHLRSVTLWDAACANFGYRTDSTLGQPYSYEDASYIDYGRPLGEQPVKPFIALVRRLDFGSALSATLTQAMGPDGQLKRLIEQASTLSFEFELLEAYRTTAITGVTLAGHAQLLEAFNSSTGYTVWRMSLCRASGKQLLFDIVQALTPLISERLHISGITLPLYFIQLKGDSSVYSYFAQRLGGALRRHASRAAAERDFKQQLVHDHGAQQLGWFARQWSLQEMGYLHMLVSEEPRPKGLSWLAGKLYDGFHQAFPRRSLETLELYSVPEAGSHQPLAALLGGRQAARYRSNLQMLAMAKSEVDWQAFEDAVLVIGNEVLGLLTTPVPGGVLGLTKIMQAAIFGSLAYSVVQGVIEVYKGESSSTFANALADTADLLISARLIGVAAKIHRQRMSTLWRQAGQPRKVIHPNGKVELRPLDNVAHPDQLALNDRQGLSDAELLQRMLPVDTLASALNDLERMLKITATSREQLQAVWQGQSIPAPLAEGTRRLQVDRLIDRIINDVPLRAEMPLNADSAVLALLTQLEHWPAGTVLDVFNQQGQRVETYGKGTSVLNSIEVKRLDHGAYVARHDATQSSARAEALFMLILDQLPETSRLGREDNEGLGQTGRIASIREQIAGLAKNDRALLFKALTGLEGRTRNDPVARQDPAKKYLPLACPPISDSTTLLLARLHQLHPSLSIESLEPLIDAHPFSPNETSQVFDRNTQPLAFAHAAERLKIKLRVDSALDGIYHPRAYHVDSDHWARACADGVLRDTLNRRLVVTERLDPTAIKPYVPAGPDDDTTVELHHYGGGRYEAYDFASGETIPVAQTGDSFYRAIASVLHPSEWAKLGMHSATDVSGLRKTLGDALLARREPSGEVNLWDRTTAAYRSDMALPSDQPAGELGLYDIDSQHYLALEGAVYRVGFDTALNKWRMQHPHIVGVNSPVLEHNGQGAWRQKSESPLSWRGLTLLRRLRAQPRPISDELGHKIMAVSNTSEGVLRQIHTNNLSAPPLLLDTWQRFQIDEDIQGFVTQLQAHTTLSQARSDVQLLLIQNLPGWPADKVLQIIDQHGKTLQEYGDDVPSGASPIRITQDEAHNGSFLRTLLARMDEADTTSLLGEYSPDLETRVLMLAQKISGHALERKAQVFKSLYAHAQRSQNPQVKLIQRSYPELPKSIIQHLLRYTTGQEKNNFLDQDLIPPRLAEQIKWTSRKVRLTRAYEGLFLGATATPDSERLMLRMLHALPGWPVNVSIEVRADGVSGQLLDRIGPQEGASLRTLVKKSGRYYAYSPEGKALNSESLTDNNLLSSILHVLDDTERAAIGVPSARETQVLATRISEQAIKHRANVDSLLGLEPPVPGRKPPMEVESSFIAYPVTIEYQGSTYPLELIRRVQRLYPSLNTQEIFVFLDRLGGTEVTRRAEVVRLGAEYATLQAQLANWESIQYYPSDGASSEMALPGTRRLVRERIERAWRRESDVLPGPDGGHIMYLYGQHAGDLPRLAGDFSHVRLLHMDDMNLYSGSNDFLSSFPQLRVLTLSGNFLSSLPPAIGSMTHLQTLNLSDNRITLTVESVQMLAGLTALRRLYLNNNLLRAIPDVSRMTQLRHLDLSGTGVDVWPIGVLSLTHLEQVNLRNNRITTIAQEVLDAPEPAIANRATRLGGNPLTPEANNQFLQYWLRTGIHMGYRLPVTQAHALVARHQTGDITPWLSRTPIVEERSHRVMQWALLRGIGGAGDDFFRLLSGLAEVHASLSAELGRWLQGRVWALIGRMLEDTALRDLLFRGVFYGATCRDGVMVMFEDLEVQVLIHEAENRPSDAQREGELFNLARRLFRLRQVDQMADAVAAKRVAQGRNPDIAEIQLIYRVRLAEALDLPIQSRVMFHEQWADISEAQINHAREHILAMDGSPAALHSIVHEQLWRNYLIHRHPEVFEPIEAQYQSAYHKLSDEPDLPPEVELQRGQELVIERDQRVNHEIEVLAEQARQAH